MMQPTLAWVLLTLTALTMPTPTASFSVEGVHEPRCSDQSDFRPLPLFLFILTEDLTDVYRGRCDCQLVGDEEGQEGSNLYLSWYENRTCTQMSYVELYLGVDHRRVWEARCECAALTCEQMNCASPATQSEEWLKEHFSYAEDQWVICSVFPATAATESSDSNTTCTQIRNSDGTVTEAVAACKIPKYYTEK